MAVAVAALSDPVAALAAIVDGRIGDFGRYFALIRRVGEGGHREAAPLLHTIIRRNAAFERTHPGFEDVVLAIEALTTLGRADAAATVRKLLATDHFSHDARLAAVRYLGRLGDRAAAHAVAAFLSGEDTALRAAAAEALARMGSGRHADAIAALVSDPEQKVRLAAALALAAFGDGRGRSVLLADLARAPRPETVEALAAVADEDTGVVLARHVAHGDPAVRAAVGAALAEIDPTRFARVLARLSDDPDPGVRAAARI